MGMEREHRPSFEKKARNGVGVVVLSAVTAAVLEASPVVGAAIGGAAYVIFEATRDHSK